MSGELLTRPLSREELDDELSWLVQALSSRGVASCQVLFGFAWGNGYYPTAKWEYEQIALGELVAAVDSVEERGLGRLGWDDLWVQLAEPAVEYRFCNDSDLHLKFAEPSWVVELTQARWQERGFLLGHERGRKVHGG
ncbi:hypothetical protein [Dyella sp.]|jgi:hypothetical protein|uniref:hypothetical protein n=1 Tax=Dyella sp. TaxID=1869338 RepID=UPI002D7A1883|nr:hypothetical protein [Dyella sp.]HET6431576.1 hypothetical protein [Dyella sp.]